MISGKKRFRVILVASAGGHWIQLNRILPAVEEHELIFMSTNREYKNSIAPYRFMYVPDSNRWNKFKVLLSALTVLRHLLMIRPEVVISTGAAPGFFAIFFGKKLGAKTIWLDSIANVEQMSLSGQKAGPYADLWLTQWEHLAKPEGPQFVGAVL